MHRAAARPGSGHPRRHSQEPHCLLVTDVQATPGNVPLGCCNGSCNDGCPDDVDLVLTHQ